MALKEVRNKNGEIAMFDDETGNIMPVKPKNAAEAPVVSETKLQTIRNKKTGGTALFDPDTGSIFPQQAVNDQIQQTAANLEATKPVRGKDLTPTPIQPKEPLFMEKYGLPRPPGSETMAKIGPALGQFALGMTPVGRAAQMGFGGVLGAMEPAETPLQRVGNAALGAVTPLIGEVGGKLIKGAAKFAGQTFSGKALNKAAGAVMDEAKAVPTSMGASPAGYQGTAGAAANVATGFGKEIGGPAATQLKATIDPLLKDVAAAAKSGTPFNYGQFYNRATQINGEAHNAFVNGNKVVGENLDKVYKGMMEDLSKIGPEAKAAADSYHSAMSGIGGFSGLKKVAAALGASGLIGGAALNPSSLMMTIPAALAGLSFRLPGVGQALAKSVIGPDGTVVKAALPAMAQMIKDYAKEQNGNN